MDTAEAISNPLAHKRAAALYRAALVAALLYPLRSAGGGLSAISLSSFGASVPKKKHVGHSQPLSTQIRSSNSFQVLS